MPVVIDLGKISERAFVAGLFLVFLLVAAVGYLPMLRDPDAVLAFNDGNIETVLSPTFAFPRALVRIWDNQFFFGSGSRQYPVSFVGLGESLFGPHQYRRLFPALILSLAGLAAYWALRGFNLSRLSSALAAGIAMLSAPSFHFAMAGLPARPVAMASAFLAAGFAERGRRANRSLPYALGGGLLGLGVAEAADVGILYAMAAAGLILWSHAAAARSVRDAARAAGRFALLVAASVLLAWQTIDILFRTQVRGVTQGAGESTPEQRYDWATQWSLPKAESWSIVSGSYFGSCIRSGSTPYWGRVGRTPDWEETGEGFRNFTMTGWGMSAAASLLLLGFAFAAGSDVGRKGGRFPAGPPAAAVLAGAGIALVLSWGRHFPLYRLVFALPFFSAIRNPEKWNGPFVFFAMWAVAMLADRLLAAARAPRDDPERRRLTFALGAAGAALCLTAAIVLVHALSTGDLLMERLLHEGYGRLTAGAVAHRARVSWKTFLLLAASGAALLAFLRGGVGRTQVSGPRMLGLLALLAGGDLLYTNSLFVMPHRYRPLTRPNPLVRALEQAGPDRRLLLLPARHPVLNNLRLTVLAMTGQDLFDPVSVSRMPEDYERLFRAFEDRPVRLWELGAVRFVLTLPGGLAHLEEMDGRRNRFIERAAFGVAQVESVIVPTDYGPPAERILRFVEFTGALPKYRWVPAAESVPLTEEGEARALARLADPMFDVSETAFVHGPVPPVSPRRGTGGLRVLSDTSVEARVEVELDAPALLVRAVRHDPDWTVSANGEPLELLRVNSLFQGAVVPAGRHTLAWSYRPPMRPVWIAVAGRAALILGLAGWGFAARKPKAVPETARRPDSRRVSPS